MGDVAPKVRLVLDGERDGCLIGHFACDRCGGSNCYGTLDGGLEELLVPSDMHCSDCEPRPEDVRH